MFPNNTFRDLFRFTQLPLCFKGLKLSYTWKIIRIGAAYFFLHPCIHHAGIYVDNFDEPPILFLLR